MMDPKTNYDTLDCSFAINRRGNKMAAVGSILWDFVNVFFEKQTYMNLFYLLFSSPLGTAYFAFFVTGLYLGFGLLLLWVVIPLLIIAFLAWGELISFERQMAIWLLGIDIPEMSFSFDNAVNVFENIINAVKNPVLWKSFLFFLLKVPLGILSIILIAFFASLTFVMLVYPLLYVLGGSIVDSFFESLLISVAGIFVGIVSLHLLNLLAYTEGIFVEKMLSSGSDI